MRFEYLCDHARLAPELARLHYAEWGPLLPDWSEAEALAELCTHRRRRAIPTTLVALADDAALIGSVSLLCTDHDDIRDYSPWLASLLVLPAHRGHGHGIALVRRCVEEAAALGIAELYLYTAGQRAFYKRLGWRDVDQIVLGSGLVDVMGIAPMKALRR